MTTTDTIRHAFAVLVLPPDANLIVTVNTDLATVEDLEVLTEELERLIPGRWLVIAGTAATTPAAPAQEPQDATERLPWHHWAPELRTRLKALAHLHAPDLVAAVARGLAGPDDELNLADIDDELVEHLEGLARRFDPNSVAEAAEALDHLIAVHGPRAEAHIAALEAAEARRR